MPNPYTNTEWKAFRDEVIELDGGRCRSCRRGVVDGVILQVHHKQYFAKKLPWNYRYSDCETLCKGCHAAVHGIIRPKVGWDYVGEEDLGDLCGTCEYCQTEIRYVFLIQHPHWEPMGVGTICCDNLTGTQLASNHMESVQRFRSRRARFVTSSRWTTNNRIVSIRQKRIELDILELQTGFKIRMNGQLGKKLCPTLEQAKEIAFEVIDNGKAEIYLNRCSPGKLCRR